MKVETEIKKWGNSLALRITGVMAELPKFDAGTKVTVEVTEAGLMVKPLQKQKKTRKLPYSEASLLEGLSSESAHADELATPKAYELGE